MENYVLNRDAAATSLLIRIGAKQRMSSKNNNRVESLLQEELSSLWRFALHLTHHTSDAEDLVQRTCLRALEKRDRYREMQKPRSWLFRIAQNLWSNELRSRKIRERGFLKESDRYGGHTPVQECDKATPESWIEFGEITNAVEALPEAQRMVMILVAVNGFSYVEAASILDVPIGTVMSRLSRARVTIGKQFLPDARRSHKVKTDEKSVNPSINTQDPSNCKFGVADSSPKAKPI